MRLVWFEVQGYKNLRTPVRLAELGRFNVLHGDNNVGKSNLLEAIGLLFMLLQAMREEVRGGPSLRESYARPMAPSEGEAGAGAEVEAEAEGEAKGWPPRSSMTSHDYFARRGFSPEEIFYLDAAEPILLRAQLELDDNDLDPGDPVWLLQPLTVGLRLEQTEEACVITITRLERGDGVDLATGSGEAIDDAFARTIDRLGLRVRNGAPEPRFALIRADRSLAHDAPEGTPLATREPLPRDLGLELYDAESATGGRRRRFDRFIAALGRFRDLVGEGQWRMRFLRRDDRAELILDRGAPLPPLPLRLMGSGIQQLAALCARLALSESDLVAIEEPELNLRWPAQRGLRDVLSELVGGAGGPSQLLATSHSGSFELEPTCYLLTRAPDGPRVDKKRAEEARFFTQPDVLEPPAGAGAPVSYVTSDGLVELPEHVRADLRLTNGGGVVFVREKDHGHYRMLTDDQYLDLLEPRGSEP